MTIDNIKEEIEKAQDIVVLTHECPDGDAVGSALAMYLTLKKLGKQVDVIIPEYSRVFEFLPGADQIKKEGKEEYDLAISVDVTGISRLNGFAKYFEKAKVKIQIDHHQVNEMFADYNFVNPASPACAQNLIFIIEQLGVEIDEQIGICLLTGIITDTGGFKYEGVSAETFEFTSWILAKGVNVSDVYKKVMQTKTKANFELRKLIMDRMEFLCDEKIAFTYMTLADEKNVGAEPGDHEGLVEIGRDIEGVEVSIFIREIENGGYKASLRSNDYVNVSDVCITFNGGGHKRAAGCTIYETLEKVKQKIINEVKKYI
ncbi:MAG: bifunctional oligoribonuclease/PAP phosphatase NrnA [Clostridiales bacterium]|nr:bifunctional oligoribonuclease/PAP phosphatase NrnA [Clostridiales bacterium]